MKEMTSTQIRARIREIEDTQEQLEKRDFDAELLTVMTDGGDINALEEKQLEAERTIRRLRVEKQALEAQLPITVNGEVTAEIEALTENCKNDAHLMKEQIDIIESAFKEAIEPALAKLLEIKIKRINAERRASQLITMHKLDYRISAQFRELNSRKLNLIKAHIKNGYAPETEASVVFDSTQYIEDLDSE
ncbi:hypothetical protein K0W35_001194 [Vibrio parahaemolyticus]|nr:hypothetical protein [Vibrio parahaemolyticus]